MIITDTHTHLYSESFDSDRDQIIKRAIQSGITRFFVPAIDSSYTERMYDLEEQYPENIFLMAGLHPTHVNNDYKIELDHIVQQLEVREFFAIGEIGMIYIGTKPHLSYNRTLFVFKYN